MKRQTVALALIAALLSGCATVVHMTTQQVPIKSDPPGAAITVACGDVENDPQLTTPAPVNLSRKPELCTVRLTKEGYRDQEIAFSQSMSPWFWGNILVGGFIGMLIDSINGAMYDRAPDTIDTKLEPSVAEVK